MIEDIVLHLSWPPTINAYYRSTRSGIKYLDKSVRKFRKEVERDIHEQVPGLCLDYPLFMEVYLHPPDKRRRDLDNYMKGLLDALTEACFWEDDVLVDQLHIYRGDIVKNGKVRIEISEAGPVISNKNELD